jgi:hypothetical protein
MPTCTFVYLKLPRRAKVNAVGDIRACVCTAAGGGAAETECPPPQELAWNYDVVRRTLEFWACVFTDAGGGAAETVCPPAQELAWNYDVVITTFQRLSSDWSMRGDPRMAGRLVLLKVRRRFFQCLTNFNFCKLLVCIVSLKV